MAKYIIHDTLEAYLVENDNEYFFGLTTAGSVNKAVSQELLRAGIHNKVFGVLSVDDGMTVSITTGLHYKDVYELQTGSKFKENASVKVHKITEEADGTFTATETEELVGDVLEFKAGRLPKTVKAQLRTIAYDKDTNEVVADLYYVFPKLLPDGNLNEEFTAGANQTQVINFSAMADKDDSYGKLIIIPREEEEEEEPNGNGD